MSVFQFAFLSSSKFGAGLNLFPLHLSLLFKFPTSKWRSSVNLNKTGKARFSFEKKKTLSWKLRRLVRARKESWRTFERKSAEELVFDTKIFLCPCISLNLNDSINWNQANHYFDLLKSGKSNCSHKKTRKQDLGLLFTLMKMPLPL